MPRTPEYDRDQVISRATATFWERGYGQTSITHLVKSTGLQPGSLYAAFGSKKGVFLEVIDAYNHQFLERFRHQCRRGTPSLAAFRELLLDVVEQAASGEDRRGCLTVNALLEVSQHEPEIADRLRSHSERLQCEFAAFLHDLREAGELAAHHDPQALSLFLVNNLWGMRVMCKANPDRRAMLAVVDALMAALEAPAPG